ncbi:MAG: GHKL domain-containing protein [Lachnotalea sp.]
MVVIIGILDISLKRILQLYLEEIQRFSEKYEEIGSYLLSVPYLIGILMVVLDSTSIWQVGEKIGKYLVISILISLIVGIQVFYLKLLVRIVHLKKHMEYKEIEQDYLQIYNQNLKKNLQEIREMKHDLKNIFLIMGEYVARSEDEEFKNYYYEKIAPYAKNEIKMNDLYVSLQALQNESLKSFLYYKLMQGMDSKVEMNLETSLDHSALPYISEVSVLTRILGIFIDNALEECRELNKRIVWVSVKEAQGELSFSVKNTVRDNTLQQGIHSGTTIKGLGRGNGLLIVEKLVKKHQDIIWNSYFIENTYVQNIVVTHN